MVCLFTADERRVTRDKHVKTWVWHEYGWEIVNVNVEAALESERCRKRRNHLRNEPVEVCVGRTLDAKSFFTDAV